MQASPPATVLPAVPRLVAIGDLHGDMGKAKRAFRLGRLIDAQDRWSGGTTTAVQVCRCWVHAVRWHGRSQQLTA